MTTMGCMQGRLMAQHFAHRMQPLSCTEKLSGVATQLHSFVSLVPEPLVPVPLAPETLALSIAPERIALDPSP